MIYRPERDPINPYGFGESYLKKVLYALDPIEGRRPRDIFKLINEGAPSTLIHALMTLIKQGKAYFTGPDMNRRYFMVITE